ncbi:MAG: DUF1638 domain-containing protein [Bacteroidales bacterium]|nr:DUF1638 domain-containing protein [Bacteroidales bacterium]
MKEKQSNIIIIACSIFKTEIEHLKSEGKVDVPVVYLNSMLHMYPQRLKELLDNKLKKYQNNKVILVFGDCHARMVDYEKNTNITRTHGINCCEIFLGTEKYKKTRKDGAFILLPEWAHRWKEVFIDYMGFKTSEQIKPFMNEMHKKIAYVDTGHVKINYQLLEEISTFLGLPIEIINSSIYELEKSIIKLLNKKS